MLGVPGERRHAKRVNAAAIIDDEDKIPRHHRRIADAELPGGNARDERAA
jgi:hypothetical protein